MDLQASAAILWVLLFVGIFSGKDLYALPDEAETLDRSTATYNCGGAVATGSFVLDPSVGLTNFYEAPDLGRIPLTPIPAPRTIGRYELKGLITHHKEADVFLAWAPDLGRHVILKVANHGFEDDERTERFLQEGRFLAQLEEHAGIGKIYHTDLHEGRPYLVLRFIKGAELTKAVEGKPQDWRYKARLMRDVARALSFTHKAKVIHQDVKPSNILVDDLDQVWVIDFGLARFVKTDDESEASPTISGTPAYMAPEQARGGEVDEKSDIFGMGAVLYHLLTGRAPYQAETGSKSLHLAAERIFDERLLYDAKIPKALRLICLKAMAKEKADRFRSAAEFAEALDRYLNRPKRLMQVAAAGTALALGLGSAAMVMTSRPKAERPVMASSLLAESKVTVWVIRGEEGEVEQELLQALPLHSGEKIAVVARIPKGLKPALFWLDSKGVLSRYEMSLVPEEGPSNTVKYTYPAPSEMIEIVGKGTEFLFVVADREGAPTLESVQSLLTGKTSLPDLPSGYTFQVGAKDGDLVTLTSRGAGSVQKRPGNRTAPNDPQEPHSEIRARFRDLRSALDRYDLVTGVGFPIVP